MAGTPENRQTKYVIDFGKIFETGDRGKKMAELMGTHIRAMNYRYDFLVGQHLVRENPESFHEEYGLVPEVAEFLKLPWAMLYENENRENPATLSGDVSGGTGLIVDGAVRTGETILRTANHLRSLGVRVEDAVVLMVRPSGKKLAALKSRLSEDGIGLFYLTTTEGIIKKFYAEGYLSEVEFEEAMQDEDFSERLSSRSWWNFLRRGQAS
jgi:hypothetical protein